MASVLIAAAWLSLVIHAIALSWIDARTHRLPNRLLASCAGIGVGLMAAAAILGGNAAPVLRGVAVGTGALAVFALAHLLGGLGMGDVKYAWILGFYLGTLGVMTAWWGLWWGFAIAAVAIMVRRRSVGRLRKARIPFGPFMTVGAAVSCAAFAFG